MKIFTRTIIFAFIGFISAFILTVIQLAQGYEGAGSMLRFYIPIFTIGLGFIGYISATIEASNSN